MAHLEDRYRGFVAAGRPVATGVVAVADSWACSNPANGRGASIGMLHAVTLRDQLREVGLNDPAAFAEAFHTATARTVEPWYRATLATDRYRLAEIESDVRGGTYDPQDSQYQLGKALGAAGLDVGERTGIAKRSDRSDGIDCDRCVPWRRRTPNGCDP